MILPRRTRGEPIVALVLILVGWIGGRAIAWESAWHGPMAEQVAERAVTTAAPGWKPVRAAAPAAPRDPWAAAGALPVLPLHVRTPLPFVPLPQLPPLDSAVPVLLHAPVAATATPPASAPTARASVAVAGGHQLLWLAATALLPFPPLGLRDPAAVPRMTPAAPPRRWSGDGWLLLRGGGSSIAPGSLAGTYGASQAGAVLRYRIAPDNAHRPAAYLRATAALNGTREQEAALGLSARPLARMPVVVMAELRALRDAAGTHARPAVALVTELPPQRLALGFTAEVYGQAGYIGGRRPTAFADGLIRAERPVAQLGGAALHAGAGAWAASQRDAARVDVGPVASVRFRLGDTASARIEADWRFRVAGDARPDSGPALTLSAGF